MPVLMPKDTAALLGENARNCNSRSLLIDRFADPTAKEDNRRDFFMRAIRLSACTDKLNSWVQWLAALNSSNRATLLYAQLQSRLMVNMTGGVMENAGLCLDRFGIPYIPGSAVKGCARRAALAALHDWCADNRKPGTDNGHDKHPLADCCAGFTSPADMLAAIARVFGWSELDWPDRPGQSDKSDFQWACGSQWAEVRGHARGLLGNPTPKDFAGSVSFLPAYPVLLHKTKVPGLPIEDLPPVDKLELDVVTCHHRDYYSGKLETATDTEEPNPVVFPAVAPGHVFAFPIIPLCNADAGMVQLARQWLATGLSVFGIGAKTNAGYGWFQCADSIQNRIEKELAEQKRKTAEEKQRQIAEQKIRAEQEARLKQQRERDQLLAGLPPDQRADKEIEMLNEAQFREKVRNFCKEPKKGGPTEEQKKAIVRALRGPRIEFWRQFKTEATKGELAKVADAIRQLSKTMNLGKMP